jgi:hypothetical protein
VELVTFSVACVSMAPLLPRNRAADLEYNRSWQR